MKTETKVTHTPGPWSVLRASDRQGFKGIGIKAVSGALLANLIFQLDDKEQANARLIAAAPELLEMLSEAKEAILNLSPFAKSGKCFCIGADRGVCTLCKINKVLAKAEGR